MRRTINKKLLSICLAAVMIFSVWVISPQSAQAVDISADALPLATESPLVMLNTSDVIPANISIHDGTAEFIQMPFESNGRERGAFDATGYDIANITNALTTSNQYDIIYFTMPTAKVLWVNLASTNANYEVSLGCIDAQGGVWFYNAASVSAGGYGSWAPPTTDGTYPYLALIVTSKSTLGSSYTLTWNKSVSTASVGDWGDFLFVSPDLADIVTLSADKNNIALNGTSKIYLGTGGTAWGAGSSQLNWSGEWLVSYGGSYGGYSKRPVSISDVHVTRNSNAKPASRYIVNYTGHGPGAGSSSFAIMLPVGENSLYHHFRSIYLPSPSGAQYENDQTDYLGLTTPRRLYADLDGYEKWVNDVHYIVVDIDSGTPIDLYGNLNVFYTNDGYTMPNISFLNSVA